MSQRMVTIEAIIQFSEERLNEIFEVPKTKALFDELMAKKENVEVIDELEGILKEIIEVSKISKGTSEKIEQLLSNRKELIVNKLKAHVLLEALQLIVDGKSLNQAVQAIISQQSKKATIFEDVAEEIKTMVSEVVLIRLLSEALK